MSEYVKKQNRYVWFGCLWNVFDMFGLFLRVGVEFRTKNMEKHLDP